MYSSFEFLGIAFDLAILTYFIGTLIMGLPIPVYGLKKWGPKLISDGIYSAVLVNLFELILYVSQEISSAIGASWANFYQWIYEVIAQELNIFFLVKVLYAVAAASEDPALNVLMSPLLFIFSFLTGLITTMETILIISYIVLQDNGLFIAMGILLMALPFRIGRSIGGALIGFAVVFYIGLPYLPNFLTGLGMNLLNMSNVNTNNTQDFVTFLITYAIPYLIESTVVLPTAYITILSGLSLGLGSAISGYSSRLPIPIDIF
ncbi:MAG: hypothetical protein ASUL_05076 [Candidatus Aramenus sulfurataquae]|uniref:Uncharacterized protein n=2 Tax=Candidatus Aramenus sulfurataquae TaxID=1326980 RepID=W7KM98_9CREN|nr:MAG: hypothetical protein ASUL_05076 [Candidatus Aramenus sulfurataquae]MBW9140615.1 hypothetical protein [Candidatus Aramenus sp.]MCL7343289.1 hypothetical protein [Candidatus Aramenus sulfurataquae]